ncbi:restriction endonuclease subunit S [Microbacterium aquimaris]|uniref:restriction endonuclease subunit S n=1 Tax=Microbacterium aquimaris TaxID=459816 RepID=UPI002AD45ED9|nr:restriction endonuclease subunit S [Microbacterium aquimaris]MDZ8275336.1 restriction endonuclease subunit S [Microbacterium aquimaris]
MSDGWARGTLGDLVIDEFGIKSGPFGTVLSASEYGAVGVPVISVGEVGYGEFRVRSETPRVGEDVTSRLPEYLLQEGDIVFGRKGAVDRSAWVSSDQDGWFLGSDGLRVRTHSGANSRFVAFQLRGAVARDWLLQHAGGSTLLSLNQGTLARVPVVIPPLAEQQAIAEVLGALDDKIAANTALAQTSRAMAIAMFRVGGSRVALRDIVTHHKRQVALATLEDDLVEHYSLPAFDAGDGPETVAPTSIKSNKFAVETEAVLVSKLNPQTPRIWPVRLGGELQRVASTEFLVLEPRSSSRWVLWALLSQPQFMASLQGMVAGTSGSHQRVKPDDVLEAEVTDPRSLDPKLVADVDALLAPVDVLLNENRTLAATRDALLPQLMSGKLRVRDAEKLASEAGA